MRFWRLAWCLVKLWLSIAIASWAVVSPQRNLFPRFSISSVTPRPFVASDWAQLSDPRYRGDCALNGAAPRSNFAEHVHNSSWCASISAWQFPEELLPISHPPLRAPLPHVPHPGLSSLSPFPPSRNACVPHWLGAADNSFQNDTLYTAFLARAVSPRGTEWLQLVVTIPASSAVVLYRHGNRANDTWLPLPDVTLQHRYPAACFAALLPERYHAAAIAASPAHLDVEVRVGNRTFALPACYLPPPPTPHHVAICTVIHNDAIWLVEWLEWHLMVGIDHIILYAHAPTDEPQLVLDPYVASGLVTVVPWPFRPTPHTIETYHAAQLTSEQDCLYRFRHTARYLAVIDTDEFLHPRPPYESVRDVLRELEFRSVGFSGLVVNDFVFQDTAERAAEREYIFDKYRHATRLMVDKYRMRSQRRKTFKMIARASDVQSWEIHVAKYAPGEGRRTVHWPDAIEILHFRAERYGHDEKLSCAYDGSVADRFLDRLKDRIANGTSRGQRFYSENLVAVAK